MGSSPTLPSRLICLDPRAPCRTVRSCVYVERQASGGIIGPPVLSGRAVNYDSRMAAR